VVEGAPLLREYTREGIVGSNPILSAILQNPHSSHIEDKQPALNVAGIAVGEINSCESQLALRIVMERSATE
jgi:hypothetical protein